VPRFIISKWNSFVRGVKDNSRTGDTKCNLRNKVFHLSVGFWKPGGFFTEIEGGAQFIVRNEVATPAIRAK